MAVQSPLLETSINGAKGVLVNVTGSIDLGLEDVETAANLVQQAAHPEANIIFGASFDDSLEDELRITVIATNFEPENVSAGSLYSGGAKPAPAPATAPGAAASTHTPSARPDVFARPEAPQQKPAAAPVPEEEEDPFDKIFQIFNKK